MSSRPQPIERRYINIYSELTPQEWRQLRAKEQHKAANPSWDDSTILALCALREYLGDKNQQIALDAGCGRGNYLLDETRASFRLVEGLDVTEEEVAGNRTCDHITFGTLEHIPFPDDTFDVVTCLWVFEHVEHPEAIVREIYRVLKPDGICIALTPNAASLLLRVKRLFSQGIIYHMNRRWYGRQEHDVFPTRYRANTRSRVATLLQQAGFRLYEVRLNEDPSYTAWNNFSYRLTTLTYKVFRRIWPSIISNHLVITASK